MTVKELRDLLQHTNKARTELGLPRISMMEDTSTTPKGRRFVILENGQLIRQAHTGTLSMSGSAGFLHGQIQLCAEQMMRAEAEGE